jgi:hypothetical protein
VSYQNSGHEAEYDEEFEGEEDEAPRPRFWVRAMVCVALAATGSGAAFAWHGYAGGNSELIAGALTAAPKAASGPQAAAAQDALLRNLTDAQQQAAVIAKRNQDLLLAQAAEIKRLSDAVAQLSTRVDGMGVRNAQAAVPAPAPKKPAAPKVVQHKPEAQPAPLSLAPEGKQ